MIDGLDPSREFGVELLQAVSGIALQPESRFKALLDTKDQSLAFSFAPTVIGLAVQQAYAHLRAY